MELWEETWTAEPENDEPDSLWMVLDSESPRCLVADTISEAQSRLIAAAPDMARVLLEVEWSAQNQYGQAQCPSCRGDEYKDGEPRTGHEEHCALFAALQKAGVR